MEVPLADDAGNDDPSHAAHDVPSPHPQRGDCDEQPDGVSLQMVVIRRLITKGATTGSEG